MTVKFIDQSPCRHCGTICVAPIVSGNNYFCCIGCKSVWSVLSTLGLSGYYEIREKLDLSGFIPISETSEGFLYFDDPILIDKIVKKTRANSWTVDFYIPEVYCAACVWLLEKLPSCDPGIYDATLSLGSKCLSVCFDPGATRLSHIVKLIKNFGYSVENFNDRPSNHLNYNREELSRLAVAVFSAMNCMMIAVSLYQGWWTGMDKSMKTFLEIVSAIIAFPAVFYSARPFILRAIAGIRTRKISLDLPLSLGIVAGYVFSIFSIIFNLGEVYFDSVSVLIALLLVARFGTNFTVTKFRNQGSFLRSVFPDYAFKSEDLTGIKLAETFVQRLKIGDLCKVKPNSLIPADSKIISGKLLIDTSVLSGEVEPVELGAGALIWGGTKVVDGEGLIELEKTQNESRFFSSVTKLNGDTELGSELLDKIDNRSSMFVTWVLTITAISFSYFFYNVGFVKAYEVALSIVVISCPCALGISVPFVFTSACIKAAREGIYFASGGMIEKTAACNNLILDKTGTLTEGSFSSVSYDSFVDEARTNDLLKKVYFLEFDQTHPIAKRISAFIADKVVLGEQPELHDKIVTIGRSVSGTFQTGSRIEVGSIEILDKFNYPDVLNLHPENDNSTHVFVTENATPVLVFYLRDKVRKNMAEILEHFRDKYFQTYLLSGDRDEVVKSIAKELNFNPSNVFSEMRPEDKQKKVREIGARSLMIGDGLNDILALKTATVGVSVTGGLELLQKVGGVMITDFNAGKLATLIYGAKSTVRAANINVGFSFFYNLTGTLIAAAGLVSPLVAAILMPISSLIVVGISLYLPQFSKR